MPGGEIDDADIIERLGKIFKDMPAYMPCPVTEYSAAHPPNEDSSRTQYASTDYVVVVVLIQCACLQDDKVKFVSEPASPPRLVEIPEEGKGKAKDRRKVGEGDDTVVVEDSSDEDDEDRPQERFQLRSRFSRPGLPNVQLIQDSGIILERRMLQSCGRKPQVSSPRRGRRHPSHLRRSLRGGTRLSSLLREWRRTRHRRGGTTLSSSVA
jgi:hypothetical protein